MDLVHETRQALCDVFDGLDDDQWHAETLCDGWDAGDLTAHLIVREREPLAAAGIVIPLLARVHDQRLEARKGRFDRRELVRQLRRGPTPWMLLGPLRTIQVGEDWIHTQDVRRGGADLGPAPAPTGALAGALWKALSRFAPLNLRSVGVEGVVELTDGERHRAYELGRASLPRRADGAADARITGDIGELVLWATGRRGADVELSGDERLVAALERTRRRV